MTSWCEVSSHRWRRGLWRRDISTFTEDAERGGGGGLATGWGMTGFDGGGNGSGHQKTERGLVGSEQEVSRTGKVEEAKMMRVVETGDSAIGSGEEKGGEVSEAGDGDSDISNNPNLQDHPPCSEMYQPTTRKMEWWLD